MLVLTASYAVLLLSADAGDFEEDFGDEEMADAGDEGWEAVGADVDGT